MHKQSLHCYKVESLISMYKYIWTAQEIGTKTGKINMRHQRT